MRSFQDSNRAGEIRSTILDFKLTKTNMSYYYDNELYSNALPFIENGAYYKDHWYCEGKKLITEERTPISFDRGVTTFTNEGLIALSLEKKRDCLANESDEECISNNRPFKEFTSKVTCVSK